MRLTVVIPALNEEQAIAAIIERTLAARDVICRQSPVSDVEVIVVSDGSTDATAEIAGRYAGAGAIELIVFERNRGYGAAIKAGFALGRGELVGFLDADGTCDPRFFADLCQAICEQGADVAIGSRLHADSCMPRVRRLGNRVYAAILGLLSNRCVTDTASGMRVIRRAALARLYPLPDRLDFTPAMSARVLMDDALSIVERPMPYRERVGRSKLSVLRDGVRFLQTIGQMALVWNPGRVFGLGAAACFLVMALLGMQPLEQWLRAGRLGEDTIYRLLFCMWLGCVGGVLLSANVVTRALRACVTDRSPARDGGAPPSAARARIDAATGSSAHTGERAAVDVLPARCVVGADARPESRESTRAESWDGTDGRNRQGAGAGAPDADVSMADGRPPRFDGGTYLGHLLDRLYTLRGIGILAALSIVPLACLIGPGVWSRLTEGHVTIHWSRVVLAGLLAFNLAQMLAATLATNVVRFHASRRGGAFIDSTETRPREISAAILSSALDSLPTQRQSRLKDPAACG